MTVNTLRLPVQYGELVFDLADRDGQPLELENLESIPIGKRSQHQVVYDLTLRRVIDTRVYVITIRTENVITDLSTIDRLLICAPFDVAMDILRCLSGRYSNMLERRYEQTNFLPID